MAKSTYEALEQADVLPDEEHPDYVAGTVSEDGSGLDALTPNPLGPLPVPPFPQPAPLPQPLPQPIPQPGPAMPGPLIPGPHIPWPIKFCGPVSGKYRFSSWPILVPQLTPLNRPIIPPVVPFNFTTVNVRVDVDRYYPQRRISVEVNRIFPNQTGHVIAEVDSDVCKGINHRVVEATITYRDGNAALIPGTRLRFTSRRTRGISYDTHTIELLDGTTVIRTYSLTFQSKYFDPVEIEVDRTANAGAPVTSYATNDHPNRPASLPAETLSLATVFQRAGFDAKMSPNTSVVPNSGAGSNSTWSDAEMHDAMVTYWSRFANRPSWAMWVFYAHRHDMGRGLGGIMFDDIGPNHRQGTAIFRDSFIQDVPPGNPDPAGFRRRSEFWTSIHEMGHGFNLAHSWQKSLSQPGGDGPWIPLANEPEARSFMNYPSRVAGDDAAFYSDFAFRFSDDELVFMRHAPRRFVQMGNEDWFENHAFEAPQAMLQSGRWNLELRPNRDGASYRFLEPVSMELKLTNTSNADVEIEEHLLEEGSHIKVFVGRAGGETKQWRAMSRHMHKHESTRLAPGNSVYGAHIVSTSTGGWLIDEPGFYKIQAAIDMGDEIVVSNVMRVYVSPPASEGEAGLADDYFTEDVGRALVFKGSPSLTKAHDTLAELASRCGDNPASCHAELALTTPELTSFKTIDIGGGRDDMQIKASRSKLSAAAKKQQAVLLQDPNTAAATIGHIRYFDHLRMLDEVLDDGGDTKASNKVLAASIDVMKERGVIERVVDNAERRLQRRTSKVQ